MAINQLPLGDKPAGRARFGKTARRVLAMLAVILVGDIALNIYASALLERAFATVHGRGEALTLAETQRPQPVVYENNAALLYMRAHASLPVALVSRAITRPSGAFTEQELEQCKASINLVRRATVLPLCRFPVPQMDTNNEHVLDGNGFEMRTLAMVMELAAQDDAKAGNNAQAITDINSIFVLSRRLAAEPLGQPYIYAQMTESTGYVALARVLEGKPDAAPLARSWLAAMPPSTWVITDLPHWLITQRGMELQELDAMRNDPKSWVKRLTIMSTAGSQSLPLLARLMRGPLERPLALFWAPVSEFDEVACIAAGEPYILSTADSHGKNRVIAPWLPWHDRYIDPDIPADLKNRPLVRRGLAECAVALAGYRMVHGHYPAHLSEATPMWGHALPLDPDSGKEFIYKPERSSYLLYSVGRNGRDDGGELRYNNQGYADKFDDIVWHNRDAG